MYSVKVKNRMPVSPVVYIDFKHRSSLRIIFT